MPSVGFGEKTHFDGGKKDYLELKTKGEMVHVRFLSAPLYDGKHFLQEDAKKWDVSLCPKIMYKEECSYCDKYWDARKGIKDIEHEIKSGNSDPALIEEKKTLENIARRYAVAISYYYPVIDRINKVFKIFKTSREIRNHLDEDFSAGVDVLKFDYKIKRLKTNSKDEGKDWYYITRLDSADTEILDGTELAEIEKYKLLDLETIILGKKSTQVLDNADDPFNDKDWEPVKV